MPGPSTSTSATSCSRAWPAPGTPTGIPMSLSSGRGHIPGKGTSCSHGSLRSSTSTDQEPHEDHRQTRPIRPAACPGHRLPLRRQVPSRTRRVPGLLRGRRRFLATGFGCPAARSRATSATSLAPTSGGSRRQAWTIAHPETLSIREQLDHLRRARSWPSREGRHSTSDPAEGRCVEEVPHPPAARS